MSPEGRGGPDGTGAGVRVGRWSRAELLLVAVLLVLSAVAWWLSHHLATPGMRLGILTGAAGSGETMPTGRSMSMGVGLFLTTWVVMMTAMMLPTVTPVVVGVARIAGARGAKGRTAYGMAAGYLVMWAATGVAAYGLFLTFQATVSAGGTFAARVGAGVLVSAGLFQISPLKRVCLRHCRSPLAVLVHAGEAAVRSPAGAVRAGVRHGLYCAGCCWALMVLLLAVGMMSLAWMAAIAAIAFVEKVHPYGEVVSRGLGALLILLGAVVAVAPGWLEAVT